LKQEVGRIRRQEKGLEQSRAFFHCQDTRAGFRMLWIDTHRQGKGLEPPRVFLHCRDMRVGLRTLGIDSAGETDTQAEKGAGTPQSFLTLLGHEGQLESAGQSSRAH